MHEPSERRWTTIIFDRLTELVIVFIGVYAAFMLSAHQSHQQERQRRGQILALLAKGAAASAAGLKQNALDYDRRMNEFLTQLTKGEMPEITAVSWANAKRFNTTFGMVRTPKEVEGCEFVQVFAILWFHFARHH